MLTEHSAALMLSKEASAGSRLYEQREQHGLQGLAVILVLWQGSLLF
jgi:hypothetical protein